jgi:hypothetical protein
MGVTSGYGFFGDHATGQLLREQLVELVADDLFEFIRDAQEIDLDFPDPPFTVTEFYSRAFPSGRPRRGPRRRPTDRGRSRLPRTVPTAGPRSVAKGTGDDVGLLHVRRVGPERLERAGRIGRQKSEIG